MKFIHCSDIHLDSSMKNFNESKARERRDELRLSFSGMISYAISEGVKAIIIAGDLFDNVVLKKTKEYVYDEIESNQEIDFLYLSGNHDESIFKFGRFLVKFFQKKTKFFLCLKNFYLICEGQPCL